MDTALYNKEFLRSHRKQGMTRVWVSARVNKLGTYIVKYEIYLCIDEIILGLLTLARSPFFVSVK